MSLRFRQSTVGYVPRIGEGVRMRTSLLEETDMFYEYNSTTRPNSESLQ